jgi:hypothetical protein
MKMKFQRQVRLSIIILASVLLSLATGCKRQESSPAKENQTPTSSAPTAAHVHEGLYRMAEQPFERDPAKRPLVLSQPASSRREWALQVLKKGYQDTGKTNKEWDAKVQALFEAFADYSRISTTNGPALQKALAAVNDTSCPDPMVQYMQARYNTHIHSEIEAASEFVKAHEAVLGSQYHPVFKFYAGLRGVQSSRVADEGGNRTYQIDRTTASLEDLARDTNALADEVFEPARLWLEHSRSTKWTQLVTANLEPLLKNGWGTTEQWFRFEGNAEVNRAWGERAGGGWSSTRAEKAGEDFAQHLSKAQVALEKAWQMNSNIAQTAYLMMWVELGQGQGLPRMEVWFNRAMSLQPTYHEAVRLMSIYLEPRWYGSEEKSLAFARSCVTSDKWGGQIPLTLVELHRSLASYSPLSNSPAYWRQPHVWNDLKSSYDKFFASNNDTAGWRHGYALDAYECGQYAAFLEQTKLFREGTNFAYFGGPEKFQQMLQTAVEGGKKGQ